jgi:hypothetical protein
MFWHPQNVHWTQCPSVYCVNFDTWTHGGRIVFPPMNISFWTFFGGEWHRWTLWILNFWPAQLCWHFVPWLHFILTYLTSFFRIKIATFYLIVTLRPFVTSYPDCFYLSLFPFCDILSLCHTFLTLCHLVHTFGACHSDQIKMRQPMDWCAMCPNPWISWSFGHGSVDFCWL